MYERRPLLPAQRPHRVEQLAGDQGISLAALAVGGGGPRPVGGELQRRQAGELPGPVVELLLQRLALQPAALPGGEVGVLDGRLGQGRGLAAAEGLVERRDLADQDAERPAVGDDVVHRHLDDVLGGRRSRIRAARSSGPRARSKGRAASSSTRSRARASRRSSGRSERSSTGKGSSSESAMT